MSLLGNQIQLNIMGASASRPMNLGANFEEEGNVDNVRDHNVSMASERMKWTSPKNENIRRPKKCQNCKLYPNVAVCGTIREQVGQNKAEGDLSRSTEELDECLENGHFPFSESPSQALVVEGEAVARIEKEEMLQHSRKDDEHKDTAALVH
ncbi:hypothetical protein GQ457_15G016720 [Hibiscus cannabinus]